MTLPCSGNVSGIAVFSIGLLIQSRKGKPVPGTPLRTKLRKECAHRGVYDRTSSLASSQGSVCLFYFLITYSPLALILLYSSPNCPDTCIFRSPSFLSLCERLSQCKFLLFWFCASDESTPLARSVSSVFPPLRFSICDCLLLPQSMHALIGIAPQIPADTSFIQQ